MIWDRRLSASERQLAPNHLKESGIKKQKTKTKTELNATQRNATVTIFGCFLALRKPLLATNRVFVDNSLEPFVLRDMVISTPSNNAIFRTTACKF